MSRYHSDVREKLRQAEIAYAQQAARAEEAAKRVAVERDRFRLAVALAASVLACLVLGGCGWAYMVRQRATRRAATERVVAEAIEKATLLRGQAKAAPTGDVSRWSEAIAAGRQARSALEAGESIPALGQRIEELLALIEAEQADAARRVVEADRDRRFLERLEMVRTKGGDVSDSEIDAGYSAAFREFGIDPDRLEPEEAGRRLRERTRPSEIALFLDDWALTRRSAERKGGPPSGRPLIMTARLTDPDPWRDELRKLIDGGSFAAIRDLASNREKLSAQPARSLQLLARALELSRGTNSDESYEESVAILKRAWCLSPSDHQVCRQLVWVCDGQELWAGIHHKDTPLAARARLDKIRFASAAVTANPSSPHAHATLAAAFLPENAASNTLFTAIVGPTALEESSEMPDYATPRWGFRVGPRCP